MVVSFSGAWMCTFPLPNTILSCRDTSLVKHQRLPAWWYVAKAELPRQVLTQAVCQIHRHKQVPYCSDVLYINIHPHPTYCVKPFHTFTQTDMYGKHTAGSHTQTHALRHIHRAVVVCHKLWADVTFSCKGPGHLRTPGEGRVTHVYSPLTSHFHDSFQRRISLFFGSIPTHHCLPAPKVDRNLVQSVTCNLSASLA